MVTPLSTISSMSRWAFRGAMRLIRSKLSTNRNEPGSISPRRQASRNRLNPPSRALLPR